MSATFVGPLATQLDEFAALMRSTGGQHTVLLRILCCFDRFLARSYPETTAVTKDVLGTWFGSFRNLRATSQNRYRTATFQFCNYLRRRDPATASREDFEPVRQSDTFHPYIYSVEEIARLLNAARALRPLTSDRLRPWSMELIVTLLYTAGLRIGEVVRLLVRDYDPTTAVLAIRETKFAKSRLVPLSESARRIVDAYLLQRRELGLSCEPEDPLRCCPSNHPPHVGSVQIILTRLMRDCGVKPLHGPGPRIHDIRHTFAVHRILAWYREGQDVQRLLPHLVTFMGHRGLESTQRYLSLIPAVLDEASMRFEKFAAVAVPAIDRVTP